MNNSNSNLFVCERCGNPYPPERGICPYCSAAPKGKIRRSKIKTENIKKNLPTVEEARRLMDVKIANAKSNGIKIVKIVHGYGSSGKGGKIKIAIIKTLNKKKSEGRIKEWIAGENFSTLDVKTREMIKIYPKLKSDSDLNKRNIGISLVFL
ncbi:Smr/MutS family protein [bacterium]|nr:Smr/MutS family protein [bacterium]